MWLCSMAARLRSYICRSCCEPPTTTLLPTSATVCWYLAVPVVEGTKGTTAAAGEGGLPRREHLARVGVECGQPGGVGKAVDAREVAADQQLAVGGDRDGVHTAVEDRCEARDPRSGGAIKGREELLRL